MDKNQSDNICPNCGAILNANTACTDGTKAGPGDISICLYCQSVNILSEHMTTLKLSQEEYDALDADIRAKIEKVIEVAKAMNIKYKE
jgi:ribosomal protein L32